MAPDWTLICFNFSKHFRPRPLSNVFGDDEDDSLTANDPFDASDVIRDAKANEGKTQRIVVRKAAPRLPQQQQPQQQHQQQHQQQQQQPQELQQQQQQLYGNGSQM